MYSEKTSRNHLHDGFGYVNNVGASKYWGVNKVSQNGRANNKWRVCMLSENNSRRQETKHCQPTWDNMTEKEAAWIASYFYENDFRTVPFPLTIKSQDGNFEYRIDANYNIHKIDLSSELTEPSKVVHFPKANNRFANPENTSEKLIHEDEAVVLHSIIDLMEDRDQYSDFFRRAISDLNTILND